MKTSNKILLSGLIGLMVILMCLSITFRMNLQAEKPIKTDERVMVIRSDVLVKPAPRRVDRGAVKREESVKREMVEPSDRYDFEKTWMVSSFDELSVGGKFNVILKTGDAPKITLSGKKEVIDFVRVSMSGNRLKIKMNDLPSDFSAGPVNLTVETPEKINIINLGGFNTFKAENLDTDDLVLNVGGKVPFCLLTGKTESLKIRAGGDFKINASELNANSVKIIMAGKGEISVKAAQRLSVRGAGEGIVRYKGNPRKIEERTVGQIILLKSND